MATPKTIAIIGAGQRGSSFAGQIGQYAHLARVTAVAEPRDEYRNALAKRCGLSDGSIFKTWQEFVEQDRLCDAVVISTMDREHVGPAVQCLRKGYDVLLEKPMSVSLEECRAIEAAQRESGQIVAVCHSLRYQKGFRKVKELIASGRIGRLMAVDLIERVAYWHQAHSFVRGNWGNEERSSFMLLAKSCHDIDYLAYIVGTPCLRASSFGRLSYFSPDHAPEGAALRCTDCIIEPTCSYSAIRTYVMTNRTFWPAEVISLDHSYEAHLEAIRTGPYGRCVWHCDNDVVDHQVVSLEFEGDVTATFTMTAFTQGGGRRLRAHGTEGELEFDEETITIRPFGDNNTERIQLGPETGGHGGGDSRVVREWLEALHSRDDSGIVANAQESLRSHTIVFAAETSRREARIVELSSL
jgi:predicted dehydrogenase